MTKERIQESNLPTKAIILAGGKGERMKPLSNYLPKVLLPILEKPLIIHHLERLEKANVQQDIEAPEKEPIYVETSWNLPLSFCVSAIDTKKARKFSPISKHI